MFLTRELLWWIHDNNVATLYYFPLTHKLYNFTLSYQKCTFTTNLDLYKTKYCSGKRSDANAQCIRTGFNSYYIFCAFKDFTVYKIRSVLTSDLEL